ncbi:MAG: indole-3-glycerol phosphate synthase TrpC, partial [Bacteroidales bacterium]|nr:indole-3-glycerol phosphate synthase TrpC [Bacteroidales bacterium]
LKIETPVEVLKKSDLFNREPLSLKEFLLNENKSGIIAEFKRKSPSIGVINNFVKVEEVTSRYEEAGVSGISVLTDLDFFGGKNEDIETARKTVNIPILRKDFIIDEYQLIEAKSIGADAILLIAAVISKEKIMELASQAKNLGLEILFEIHNKKELEKLNDFIDIVGVNNRNLKTFEVSINTSIDLSNAIPDRFIKISESGISNAENIKILKNAGYQGFLIGENFMKNKNPGKSCKEFIKKLKSKKYGQ